MADHQPSVVEVMVGSKTRRHFKFYTVFICFFASLAGCAYSSTAAVIGTTLGQPSFFIAMGLNESNSASLIGAINSLYYTGGIFGAICHGWVADKFGRKIDLFIGVAIITISQALLVGSVNPAMFIVFRFFCGWGYISPVLFSSTTCLMSASVDFSALQGFHCTLPRSYLPPIVVCSVIFVRCLWYWGM